MRFFSLYTIIVLSIASIVFNSCQKELSCEGCNESNKPPIALAGPDQVITLPTDTISLDGSSSSDPDGTISEWLWTKISGPASVTIGSTLTSKAVVKNLAAGSYKFELKVKDDGGLFAKDTVMITVDAAVTTNHPPIANAGADQKISLPTNTIILDGSGSSDPDNNIAAYAWIQISGPGSFDMSNPNASQTEVKNLVEGIYEFELKITDTGGLFAKDTVIIKVMANLPVCEANRPITNIQLIPVAEHPRPRLGMAIASAGNKIVFAGGGCNCLNDSLSRRVDVYDIINQSWSTAQLSEARNLISVIAAGDRIFFAGGEVGDGTWPVSTVDIYNVGTNGWSTAQLSTAGHSITAATVGDKVLFAGGDGGFSGPGRSRRVDIFNLTTNSWSTAELSEPKEGPTAVTVNNKVFFSGGYTHNFSNYFVSDKIDIYDNTTNTWSESSLYERRVAHGGIALADKIYWAGGTTDGTSTSFICSVEIEDLNTGSKAIQSLSAPAACSAVLKNNKILYFTRNGMNDERIDIYDVASATWSIAVLPQNINGFEIISVNNTLYVAGGFGNAVNGPLISRIWKLEF